MKPMAVDPKAELDSNIPIKQPSKEG